MWCRCLTTFVVIVILPCVRVSTYTLNLHNVRGQSYFNKLGGGAGKNTGSPGNLAKRIKDVSDQGFGSNSPYAGPTRDRARGWLEYVVLSTLGTPFPSPSTPRLNVTLIMFIYDPSNCRSHKTAGTRCLGDPGLHWSTWTCQAHIPWAKVEWGGGEGCGSLLWVWPPAYPTTVKKWTISALNNKCFHVC